MKKVTGNLSKEQKARNRRMLWREIKKNRNLYLFIMPMIIWLIIFKYIPMPGILIAFEDYSYKKGIFESDWVGLKWFIQFFESAEFWKTLKNTFGVTLRKLIIGFPIPIIFALLLNEIKNSKFQKIVQTCTYLPHFVSWVIIVQLMRVVFTPYGGIVNSIRNAWGLGSIYFMGRKEYFYALILGSDIWAGTGWASIVYLAAIAGVDQSLYEAAMIDGANRLHRVWHITLPSISTTIVLLLIMRMSSLMSAGVDQVLLLQSPANLELSQVLDTYTLQVGLKYGKFELATAIGLVGSVVSLICVWTVNNISRRITEVSLW